MKMNHTESKKPVLDGNDILFECGQCGKSLAIDCRGAGLNIRCPQCDSELEAPIPEGFDLAELDKEISEAVAAGKELKISMPDSDTTAAAVSAAAEQIETLKAELEAVRAQRPDIPRQKADLLKAIKTVHKQIDELRKALDELGGMLTVQTGSTEETQEIL